MKTITISDECADFIKNLSERMKTQDNRSTASPFYITIQKMVDRMAGEDCGDKIMYYSANDAESYTEEEVKEKFDELLEDGEELDFEEYIEENFQKYETREESEYEGFFLTYEGYRRHVEMNGHNIARTCNSFHNYVQYANRNPELEELYSSIHEIASKLQSYPVKVDRDLTEVF